MNAQVIGNVAQMVVVLHAGVPTQVRAFAVILLFLPYSCLKNLYIFWYLYKTFHNLLSLGKQCKNTLPRRTCQRALVNFSCDWKKFQRGCKATCRVCCGNIWRDKKCNRLKYHCHQKNIGKKCRKSCRKC